MTLRHDEYGPVITGWEAPWLDDLRRGDAPGAGPSGASPGAGAGGGGPGGA